MGEIYFMMHFTANFRNQHGWTTIYPLLPKSPFKYSQWSIRQLGAQLKQKPNQRKQTSKLNIHYWLLITFGKLFNTCSITNIPTRPAYLVFCISKPAAPKSNRIHVGPRTRVAAWKFSNGNVRNLIISVGASYFDAIKTE